MSAGYCTPACPGYVTSHILLHLSAIVASTNRHVHVLTLPGWSADHRRADPARVEGAPGAGLQAAHTEDH